MNAMTCQEAAELLDLLAADACDPPTRDTVERHLGQCEACAASYAESQRAQVLLDLHLKTAGVERLQRRIEEEAQPRRKMRSVAPFVRRASQVAALFLITAGLLWWLPRATERNDPEFALLVRAGMPKLEIIAQAPARLESRDAEVVVVLPSAPRSGNAFRNELLQAERAGKLPLPPAVSLELTLVNSGKRTVKVQLGDAKAKLSLQLSGDGVIRLAAPHADTPESLRPQTLLMEPGKQFVFPIDRLVAGSPGKLEYIYLTEPGEITLTPRLRLTADGKAVTVTGATVRIKVKNQPADPP